MIPEVTIKLIREMEAQEHTRRMVLNHHGAPLLIDVFPGVFPSASPYSTSSSLLRQHLATLTGQMVLDIGCGTGVESIAALLSGACSVDAVDIETIACRCTAHNATLNNVSDRISVYQGDMFTPVECKQYDLIIANLPIVDCELGADFVRLEALIFDYGYRISARYIVDELDYRWINYRVQPQIHRWHRP